MNHKSLLMFLWACLVAFQLTKAQSFCLDVGDGVEYGKSERVTAMVGSGTDLAFVGWNGNFGLEQIFRKQKEFYSLKNLLQHLELLVNYGRRNQC